MKPHPLNGILGSSRYFDISITWVTVASECLYYWFLEKPDPPGSHYISQKSSKKWSKCLRYQKQQKWILSSVPLFFKEKKNDPRSSNKKV